MTRIKKGREEQLDLAPDLVDMFVEEGRLGVELKKGSPLLVAAHLFDMDVEDVRRLGVHKVGITLKKV